MIRFETVLQGKLEWGDSGSHTTDEMEAFVDRAVEELSDLEPDDIDVRADLETGRVRVSITVLAEDPFAAGESASGTIRTAFHAAEVATPNWSAHWIKVITLPEEGEGSAEEQAAELVHT